ncbi:unnamed protein product [Penicillium egyptiacum]|uniref:Uncharacterized protein n=1 Tax=Penicillium egyptiacum TaxID=1303716 RepID=A0A9W4KJX9_9EURO|nr:unnamed protein product [Penicillium egyptiacum]
MARTAQNVPPSRPHEWRQREYLDHQGNPVILGKVSGDDDSFDAEEKHTIQIYSKTTIQPADFTDLYRYLKPISEDPIFLEIYTPNQDDAFACVEHQRREIAYRKRLYADTDQPSGPLPPLIPTFRISGSFSRSQPNFDTGSCLLLTSDSYQAGWDSKKRDEIGTGPLWIDFTRKFSNQIREIDLAARVEFDELDDIPFFAEYGTGVFPEATEVTVKLKNDQTAMDQYIESMLDYLQKRDASGWELDYGTDELVSVQTTWDSQQVKEILNEQRTKDLRSMDPDTLSLSRGPRDTEVTIKNHSGVESDLQYVIYVQFLADILDPALLETTARLFTAHVISKLGSNKTVRFDFKIPGLSLSSILSFPNDLPVGALHSPEDGSERQRILPLRRHDIGILPDTTCEQFAVVLDKPAFVTEPGVLFFMNNLKPKDFIDHRYPVAEVRRSAGMFEVVRRLAMLGIEEKLGNSPNRDVTKEECLALLGLSLAQYQDAVFEAEQN